MLGIYVSYIIPVITEVGMSSFKFSSKTTNFLHEPIKSCGTINKNHYRMVSVDSYYKCTENLIFISALTQIFKNAKIYF